ncbi:MAG TPA: hypothetical protein VFM25_01275 [Verrucomicrobiae bacterium]|nr:hypothetical protein [Verrucomicrobiae bacterium]
MSNSNPLQNWAESGWAKRPAGNYTGEKLAREEIDAKLRSHWQLHPDTPGLKEAARDLFRPRIESMRGREIVYTCHVSRVVRVRHLETDDDGFKAVAFQTHDLGLKIQMLSDWGNPTPLTFSARWECLRLCGDDCIGLCMLADNFNVDPDHVARAKAAAKQELMELNDSFRIQLIGLLDEGRDLVHAIKTGAKGSNQAGTDAWERRWWRAQLQLNWLRHRVNFGQTLLSRGERPDLAVIEGHTSLLKMRPKLEKIAKQLRELRASENYMSIPTKQRTGKP